jgi:hypothetical protein
MLKKTVLPLVILMIALTGLTLGYRAGHPIQNYLFNSDALYLPTLFADLIGKGTRLSDWYLTPAPYFFPDFPIYLIAYLSGKGAFEQILVFALLQIVLATIGVFFIVKTSTERHRLATTSLIVVALIWLAMNAAEPYVELLTSAYHFGAFLAGMAFVALWLHLDRTESTSTRRWAIACMCLLAFLTSLSDNIFLVQVILPFLAVCILIPHGMSSGKRRFTIPSIVFFSSVLGSVSYRFVVTHDTRYPTKLGWAQLDTNIHDLLQIFEQSFTAFPLLGIAYFAYVCIGVAYFVPALRKRAFFRMPRSLITLIAFSMVSMGGTVAAVLLVKNLGVSPRYLIPMFIWPVIIIVLVLRHSIGEKFFWLEACSSALIALSLITTSLRVPQPATPGYYPEQIACIDNALAGKSLHNGVAQYWDAKRIQMLSRQPITLAQYYSDLTPMKWITSEKYYRDTYDFAIIAEDGGAPFKLPVDLLTAINNAPAEKISCGNRTVLVYGPDKLRLKKIGNTGSSFVWHGCELPMVIGKPTATCEAEKKDPSLEGYVTFGPYEPLPAGEYAFELTYVSSKTKDEAAGEWDVVLALPNEARRLLVGRLSGTEGRSGSVSGKFLVEKKFDMTKIEIRAFANKGGTLKVISLRLTRTQ